MGAGLEFDFSIVVPASTFGNDLIDFIEQIVYYFHNRPASFEVLVLDLSSAEQNHDIVVSYAAEHPELHIMRIPHGVYPGTACMVCCLRSRGRLIFLFNPSDKIPIAKLEAYENKLLLGRNISNMVVVAGRWRDDPDDYSILRSSLNIYSESLTSLFQKLNGVKPTALAHAQTFLLTRDAVRVAFMAHAAAITSYDLELAVIASKTQIEFKTVKLNLADPFRYTMATKDRVIRAVEALEVLIWWMFPSRKWRTACLQQGSGSDAPPI
jgi:hypothetical protein